MRAWAEELVANAMALAPPQLSTDEAFAIYQGLMQNLQSATKSPTAVQMPSATVESVFKS